MDFFVSSLCSRGDTCKCNGHATCTKVNACLYYAHYMHKISYRASVKAQIATLIQVFCFLFFFGKMHGMYMYVDAIEVPIRL